MKLRSGVVVAVVLGLAAPAGVGAAGEDKALSLHAWADHRAGAVSAPAGNPIVGLEIGHATVSMPPQTDAAVERGTSGGGYVLDTFHVTHTTREDIADGNLAAGTAFASSYNEWVEIKGPGLLIEARGMRAVARASCDGAGDVAQASAGSSIASLVVNGEAHSVGEPNQFSRVVELPDGLGTAEIEALTVTPRTDSRGWTTTGLRIRLAAGPLTSPAISTPLTTASELRIGFADTSLICAG